MKRNNGRIFLSGLLLIFCLMGASCPSRETTESDKIAQTEIYQSYSVKADGEQFRATVFFRIGGKTGTTLALVAPSKITCNGQPMQEVRNSFSGTSYSLMIPRSATTGTFVFSDRNGKNYTNTIDLRATNWRTKINTINAAQSFAIPLANNINSAQTDFRLELNSANNNSQTILFSGTQADSSARAHYDANANAIVIEPAAWQEIRRGAVTLNLGVTVNTPVQQGTRLGGEIQFDYEPTPLRVNLLKAKKLKC